MMNLFRQKFNLFHKGEGGFTLIELIFVILILGLLVKIAIPELEGILSKGKANTAESSLVNIQTALRIYNAENGQYPDPATWESDLKIDGTDFTYSTQTDGSGNHVTYVVHTVNPVEDPSDGGLKYYYADSTQQGVQKTADGGSAPTAPTP